VLEKSIKQLNRVSISVNFGLGLELVLGLGLVFGLVLGLVLGLVPSRDIVLKSTVLSSSCVLNGDFSKQLLRNMWYRSVAQHYNALLATFRTTALQCILHMKNTYLVVSFYFYQLLQDKFAISSSILMTDEFTVQ